MTRTKIWLLTCLLALAGFQSTTGFAAHLGCPDPSGFPTSSGCSLPGVRSSGFPYFDQGVKVHYRNRGGGAFSLKARYNKKSDRSSLVMSDTSFFDIDKTKFKFNVKVVDGVAKGSVQIKGRIQGIGMNKRQKLMSANLEGAWAMSADGQLLGFNTMDIECNPVLPINCTDAESIYLALVDAINTGEKNIKTTGVAITTVPLPAGVWLFGSGLICLVGMARKRRVNLG